jgi:glucosamine--fructose-6-phosphate aminotransferase (isomerizing)
MHGPMFDVTTQMLGRIERERSTNLLTVTDDPNLSFGSIVVPRVAEWLSPIPAIVAAQTFAAAMADLRGIDPERPRGLEKVTSTR